MRASINTCVPTMNLKNAKLGERYNLYTDSESNLVGTSMTIYTVTGTVIGLNHDGSTVLFGWKTGETKPKNAKSRDGISLSSSYKYYANQGRFNYSVSMKTDAVVKSKVLAPGEMDGCQCKKCHNFYPYAEPNQEDGTLVCYSCRTSW